MLRFIVVFSFLFFASVLAQSAEHMLNVSIPTVLQLRIYDEVVPDGRVPLDVYKTEDGVELSRAETRLELMANTGWQLQVKIGTEPVPVQLYASLNQANIKLTNYPQILAAGTATRGWQNLLIYYRADSQGLIVEKASYKVQIYYFLTQP